MYRRLYIVLLQKHNTNFRAISSQICSRHFSASAPSFCQIQPLKQAALSENIQGSKDSKPLIIGSVDSILANVSPEQTTFFQCVSLLKALRMQCMFKDIRNTAFINDERFKTLCEIFQIECCNMAPNILISGLRSLLEVGVPSNSKCVVSAEKAILEKIHHFNSFHLIRCLYFHHRFMQTELQQKVIMTLVSEIYKKVSEISSSEILMLIHVYHLFDKDQKVELDNRVAECLRSMNMQEICKILITLAEKSNRNVFILNSAVFHLKEKNVKPGLKETVDIFYALKKLNFFDPKLCSYLLNDLDNEIPSISQVSLISGILTACGFNKWRKIEILDACGEWIKNHLDLCRTREFISFVLTVATLNHSSSHTKNVLDVILPHLTADSIGSPDVLLDVAWSLAILDHIPKELLLHVLKADLYKCLQSGSKTEIVDSNILKLLNLKSILKSKYPECVFGCDLYLEPIKLQESSVIESSKDHVIKVLMNFLPRDKYLNISQVNDMGILIDAEFLMSDQSRPLSLHEYGTMATASKDTKPLPRGSRRIALLIKFQRDYTQCVKSLTGVNALAARLLTEAGFSVVIVPYEEFSQCKTEVLKAKYLMQKITLK